MKRFIMVLAVAALMAAMLAAMAVPAFASHPFTPRQGNNGLIDAAYKSGLNAHPPCVACSPDTPYTYFPDRP